MPDIVTLYAPGAIPGIAGEFGPGSYTVDYDARTATPVPPPMQTQSSEAQVAAELQQIQAADQQQPPV